MAEDIRRTTWEGIPLDEQLQVLFAGKFFRIPWGYVAPWPKPDARKIVTWPGLAFNFWLPSRRYVEIDHYSLAGFQPKEQGRPPPGPNERVVKVHSMAPATRDQLGTRAPMTRFRNYTTAMGGIENFSFAQDESGLVRYWHHNWPHPLPEPFLNYIHSEGSDPEIQLRCTPDHRMAPVLPSPVCDGYGYRDGPTS